VVAPTGSRSSGPSPTTEPSPSPQATSTESATPAAIIGELDAQGDGWYLTKAGDALWIQVDPPVDTILRIDIDTGIAQPTVAGGRHVTSGADGLWVTDADSVIRLDPETGDELVRVEVDSTDGPWWPWPRRAAACGS
jgi:hypothetical protein